jgi:glycosyltransferase involved in cell wall biosynthesis
MNIAYIVSAPNSTFVTNEIESHDKAGWSVLPIYSCSPTDTKNFSVTMEEWSRKALYRPAAYKLTKSVLLQIFTNPLRFFSALFWLIRLLFIDTGEFLKGLHEFLSACYFSIHCRKSSIKHIHIHFASRSLTLGILIGILNSKTISCTVHAFDIFSRSAESLKFRLKNCSFISSISNYNIEYLRKKCGDIIADKCIVVHCGIDLELFNPIDRNPLKGYLLSICNLVMKKGLHIAIEACGELKKRNIDFTYKIVGDGPMENDLKQLAKKLNIENNVLFLGKKPNDQLTKLFAETSAFVLPSIKTPTNGMDGIPVALMEAMASKVPVVSTFISGIPELIDNQINGFLAEPGSVRQLADILEKILNGKVELEKIVQNARQKIENQFNIITTSRQIRDAINRPHPEK